MCGSTTAHTSRSRTRKRTWRWPCPKPGAERRPLLIDIRTAQPLDADARHHYSGQTLVERFSALALLVEGSPFGRMMGNVYLRIARPGIPTQLFSDEARAVEWLNAHRS